jgi:hypothetical protein
MVGLMLALPGVSAPFMLLIKGEDTTIPAGTHLNAFVDGDMKLDLEKFGVPEIPAEKQPATSGLPRSTLTIDSSPEGAQIALDGKSTYRTPATFTISQSVHQITLSRDGYLIWTASVDLTGKSAFHVAAELIKPQPDPGPAH